MTKGAARRALEFVAEVDAQHRLHLELPDTAPGTVRVLILGPEPIQEAFDAEGEADAVWMQALTREWQEELSDPREDIYTLEDGEPVFAH